MTEKQGLILPRTNKDDFEVGDIVQITNPEHPWYSALVIVTKVKDWGIVGYIVMPISPDETAQTFVRLSSDIIMWCGTAHVQHSS